MKKELFKIEKFNDFFKLINCVVDDNSKFSVDLIVENYSHRDWEKLRNQAVYCGIEGLIFWAVKNTNFKKTANDIFCEMEKISASISYKNIMFRQEVSLLANAYKKIGIECTEIKGQRIVECYPDLSMRRTQDIDLLLNTDPHTKREYIVGATKMLGYQVDETFSQKNYCFIKKPIYILETHFSLFSKQHGDVYYYYKDPWRFFENKSQGKNNVYCMSTTEEFTYLLCHNLKHYMNTGMSVRWLIDLFVYYKKYCNSINLDYVEKTMDKVGLLELYVIVVDLYNRLVVSFDFENIKGEPEVFLSRCLESGVSGKRSILVNDKVKEIGKAKYILNRLWPDPENYKSFAPFVYRHRIARILYPVVRLRKSLTRKDRSIRTGLKSEIDALFNKS